MTLNVTDADDDDNYNNLTYSSNFTLFTQTKENFTWTTNYTNSGTYIILFNVSDGHVIINQTVTLTVQDIARLSDNASNITSSLDLNIFVNGTLNESSLEDVNTINVTDKSNNSIILFDWNFSIANISVDVNYSSVTGAILVQGLNLSSQNLTKTVYINKSTSTFNYVCLVDDVINSLSSMSADCSNTNETLVACPGTNGVYSCAEEGNYFKITGLNHSAAKGVTVSSGSQGGSGSPGGGGTSGGDDDEVIEVCKEDWICTGFGKCENGKRTQQCWDAHVCGTTLQQPLLEKDCVEDIIYKAQEPEPEVQPEPEPTPQPIVKEESSFKKFFTNIANWFKNVGAKEQSTSEFQETTDEQEVEESLNLEKKGQKILLFSIGILAFLLVIVIIWKR